jgi:hypothetical protein
MVVAFHRGRLAAARQGAPSLRCHDFANNPKDAVRARRV